MTTKLALNADAHPAGGEWLTRLALIDLGVVCPMANEAATAVQFVESVLDECARFPFRSIRMFVVIDRASRDSTRTQLVRHQSIQPTLRVVWAPDTNGVAEAYIRGYREAIAAGSEWILEIDAGFSHSPQAIPAFIEAMSPGVDCVFGSRFKAGGKSYGTVQRRILSRGGTAITNLLLGTRLSDMTSGFQLFSRGALESVLTRGVRSTGPFFQTEMKASCRRLRVVEIPIEYRGGSRNLGWGPIGESLVNLGWLCLERARRRL
jgi:dolichol-phosphate mannosyltransferase